MSAKYALLGLLLDKPGYKYELADRLERRLGPEWALNPGQISQTMMRLERDGLVETIEAPAGHPERKSYAITSEGTDEFERWFDERTGTARPSRRPMLVKAALAGPARLERALERLDDYERDRTEALRGLVRLRDAIDLRRRPVHAHDLVLRLGLACEILQLEADLAWSALARETLAALAGGQVLWPFARPGAQPQTKRARERQGARAELFANLSARGRLGFSSAQPHDDAAA